MLTAGAGAVSALLSCAFTYLCSLMYLFTLMITSLRRGNSPPYFEKKKKKNKIRNGIQHNRKTKGQQGVRLRLRAKTGVLLPCLVNSEIQSLSLPVPLSV